MSEYNKEKMLAATLYPIKGIEGVEYVFRVLKIRETIPQDSLRSLRLQRWADRLWRRELRCPVYPTSRFGVPAFLIPEGNSPDPGACIQLEDVPDKTYHIDVTDQTLQVAVKNAIGTERELVCRMLERPFSDRFVFLRDKFWRAEWTLFYRMVPENSTVTQDIINAFRGLKFGVVLLEDQGPYLVADPRTRYVGRRSLAAYTEEEKKSILQDHLDLSLKIEDRASFIRDNGPVKIPCRYAGEANKTAGECTYDESGETIFQYYKRMYSTLPIAPNDPIVFVQDRSGAGNPLPVPASRIFPVFTTEFEGLRSCSVRPQMLPEQRVATIRTFLQYLVGIKYGETPISVSLDYLIKERTVFIPPRLEFGKGEIVAPFAKESVPSRASSDFDTQVVNWGAKKLPALYTAGPYHNEPLPDAVLLYPHSIDRPTRETFLEDLKKEIQQQTGQVIRVVQQRPYSIGQGERMGSSLLNIATEVKLSGARYLAIVILWDRFSKSVHGELKNLIKPILSQCIMEKTVRNICLRSNPQQATSQTRNTSLAVLTEGGVKPWVLADNLHYDLYLGIDLLFGRIGYHFFFGTGGRLIERYYGESMTRGRMNEAIKEPTLRRQLEKSIIAIVQGGCKINSIIIHRDGRWWPSESAALHNAVENLKAKNILPADVRCAAVEIRKNHIPVRLFTVSGDAAGRMLQNPLPGTYLVLDNQKVILTTTGRPGAWDRRGVTAGTLLLEIVDSIGDINIESIAEDAYRLTHLNWNAPDIEIGLPVTIRWADEALRETLRTPAEEEEEEAEWEQKDAESNNGSAEKEASEEETT